MGTHSEYVLLLCVTLHGCFLLKSLADSEKTRIFAKAFITNDITMTEIHKQYRLSSMEDPTDEMLHALMEDMVAEARKSMANAEAEKKRRLQAVAEEISAWRVEQ